jgi:DNA-binding response OmpR family regulator
MSAHSDPGFEIAFRRAGADAYLAKPIVVRDLLAAIASVTTPHGANESNESEWGLARA